MLKRLSGAALALILAMLACNAPQQSDGTETRPPTIKAGEPMPVCTPPLCATDETYYCPDECPGGCGIECATVTPRESTSTPAAAPTTPGPPTSTPVVAPTDTLMPVCTPPACATDEVYYCPGECPGGCGTECATPTPTPPGTSPPTIQAFTADRTTIVEGESVTLSWQATGGSEAFIQWVTSEAILGTAPGPLNPDGGSVSITPTGDGDITLMIENSAGSAEAHVQILITCPHPWATALDGPPPLASGCPGEAISTQAAQQSFERGFMIWVEAEQAIYVFYENPGDSYPTYEYYTDHFVEGDPESDPTLVPPAGLYQPIRGFGLVWRANPHVRERLGWATAPEAGFSTWKQGYQGMGMHNAYTLMEGLDGTIYHLIATGSVWEVYTP